MASVMLIPPGRPCSISSPSGLYRPVKRPATESVTAVGNPRGSAPWSKVRVALDPSPLSTLTGRSSESYIVRVVEPSASVYPTALPNMS